MMLSLAFGKQEIILFAMLFNRSFALVARKGVKAKMPCGAFSCEFQKMLKNKKICGSLFLFAFFCLISTIYPAGINQGFFFVLCASFLGCVPLAFLIAVVISALNAVRNGVIRSVLGFPGKVFLLSFVFLALLWVILAFLPCYPAICTTDTEDIFKMILGLPFEANHFRYDALNNHHPAFYVLLIAIPFWIGSVLGFTEPMIVGCAALLHLLTLALLCGLIQGKLWVMTKSRAFCLLTFAFFLLNPLIVLYSVTLWKDVVFSGVFVVYVLELLSLLIARRDFFSSRSDIAVLGITTLLCLLLRNNAFAVIVPMAVILCLVLRDSLKPLLILFSSAILLGAIIVGPLYSILGIKSGHFSESLSIPLQQIARVAADASADLSEDQYAYLDELLPFEQYEERYNSQNVNFIKFAPDFNDQFLEENKELFLENYLSVGIRNPKLYTQAWLDQTQAFWNPASGTWYTTVPGYSMNDVDRVSRNLTNGALSYEKLVVLFDVAKTIFAPAYNSAFLAWLIIFSFIVLFFRKNRILCVSVLPLLFWWATFLIAAPAVDFRYMFPIHLALPVVFFILFYAPKGERRDKFVQKNE